MPFVLTLQQVSEYTPVSWTTITLHISQTPHASNQVQDCCRISSLTHCAVNNFAADAYQSAFTCLLWHVGKKSIEIFYHLGSWSRPRPVHERSWLLIVCYHNGTLMQISCSLVASRVWNYCRLQGIGDYGCSSLCLTSVCQLCHMCGFREVVVSINPKLGTSLPL